YRRNSFHIILSPVHGYETIHANVKSHLLNNPELAAAASYWQSVWACPTPFESTCPEGDTADCSRLPGRSGSCWYWIGLAARYRYTYGPGLRLALWHIRPAPDQNGSHHLLRLPSHAACTLEPLPTDVRHYLWHAE